MELKGHELWYNVMPQKITVDKAGSVTLPMYTNSVLVINQGDGIVIVNAAIKLYPGDMATRNGESYTFGGNANEIYTGEIYIQFDGGANNLALVMVKAYNPDFGKRDFVSRW